MNGVLYTAGSITAATILGSVLGCLLTDLQHKTYHFILSFAAGIMLCAAIQGLLLPALEETSVALTCSGIGLGAGGLFLMNCVAARLLRVEQESSRLQGMMFVFAIAIHHLPEGLAAGVSFGTGETAETVSVCAAIALQNIPEAMMIMPVMSEYGWKKAILAATASGFVEICGLALGYVAVQLATQILPFMLAFAAGAMVYVIFENMLPDSYESGDHQTTAGIMLGYCGMLLLTDGITLLL